jgi:HlyD family secretion protein
MKKKHKKKIIIVAVIVLLLCAGGSWWSYQYYNNKATTAKKKFNSIAASPYLAFARGRVDVDGGVVKLSASKDGVLRDLLVEEGDKVKKGQPLCKLDDFKEKLYLAYCKAEADLALRKVGPLRVTLEAAAREKKRSENLIRQDIISRQRWDETNDLVERLNAEIQITEAEAQVAIARQKQAEYDVELKVIRAPADGKILRCDARPGYGISTLNVTVLFLFVPEGSFIVRAEVEEKFIKTIKVGTLADIIPDSDETKTYTAKVIKMGNYLGPKRLSFDEPQEKNDVRTTECILAINEKDLILGQRVLVKFKKADKDK